MKLFEIFNPNGYDANYAYGYLMVDYWKGDGTVCFNVADNKIDGFDTETYFKKNEEQYGKIYRFKDLIAKEGIIGTFKGTPVYADSKTLRMADGTIIGEFNTGGVILTSEWDKLIFKNGSSIEVLPQKDDTVRGENHFCDGFRGGKMSTSGELIVSHTEMERAMDSLSAWATNVQLDKETVFNGLSQVLKRATEVYSSTKEEKNLKFTFYTTEGYRIDKSNNTKIPTMTTEVLYKDNDGCAKGGSATCDKVDYDERQGCLEAIANAVLGGNFDRDFNRAVKANEFADKKKRTCTYCGQLFDTAEEKQAHEAWHVERKKARRERYLLRKRAKEIAFEEQAQKMAKEIIAEDNKK